MKTTFFPNIHARMTTISCRIFICIFALLFPFQITNAQSDNDSRYKSYQGSLLIFHNDGTYEYHYSPGCDICMTPPIKTYNRGEYIKHRNRAYYLYSDTTLDPMRDIIISGNETQTEDTVIRITILDSIKERSENLWHGVITIWDLGYYREYYYQIKVMYTHDSLDSIRMEQRYYSYFQNYNDTICGAWMQADSILLQQFREEDRDKGIIVANTDHFQQAICYGQQLELPWIKGMDIESIDIEIHPLYRQHDLYNYTDGYAHCIYMVNQSGSTDFTLTIPENAYQKIHNPFYVQEIAEIINAKSVYFDRQFFYKLPLPKRSQKSKKDVIGFKMVKFEKRIGIWID